jgi:dihydroorotase
MKYLIFGGELADGTKSDILVADGEIVSIGLNLDQSGSTLIDATGCKVLPGLVDLHTHLREPGREDSETVLSGSTAAVVGG